jgi:peptidoglycan/LPS O-acetylase OafA/YrhL
LVQAGLRMQSDALCGGIRLADRRRKGNQRKHRAFAVSAAPGLADVISYGVYIYHVFASRIVGARLRAIAAPEILQTGMPLFIASALLTLAVANVAGR